MKNKGDGSMFSQEEFKYPGSIHRGTELWMLNDKLEDDELKRQIAGMKKQGFYSFITRTYVGLSALKRSIFYRSVQVVPGQWITL
jgi:hypothetical protein